jgi:hypothetical protein
MKYYLVILVELTQQSTPPNALTYNQLVEGIWQKHWEHKKRYYNRFVHFSNNVTSRELTRLNYSDGTARIYGAHEKH